MDLIPGRCLFHSLALLPGPADPRQFVAAAQRRWPGLRAPDGWKAVAAPRACVFGPLEQDGWRWQVVLDLGKIPETSWRPGFGDARPPAHRAHAFVFLTDAPEASSGLDRVRAGLSIGLAWIDAGASALAFPTGGIVEPAETLASLRTADLDAERVAALLVSSALMGRGADSRTWLRTRGMSHFGLPDLCCALPNLPVAPAGHLEDAQTLFGSLAPYLVSLGRPIREGESVEVGARAWRAMGPGALADAPAWYGTLVPFELAAPPGASRPRARGVQWPT